MILQSKRRYFLRTGITVRLPSRKLITHAADTACERMVASAAPRTPIWNTKINSGSSTMLSTAPIKTESIAVFALPCALIKVFNPNAS